MLGGRVYALGLAAHVRSTHATLAFNNVAELTAIPLALGFIVSRRDLFSTCAAADNTYPCNMTTSVL